MLITQTLIEAGGENPGIVMPMGQWHTLECLDSGTFIMEGRGVGTPCKRRNAGTIITHNPLFTIMPNDNDNLAPSLVHSHDVQLDTDYVQWLVELKSRYRSAQIKAAVRVNAEKLLFNWQLGRDLVQLKAESRWGTGIVEQLSLDLQAEFPGDKGFGTANLWYMKKWYLFYTQADASEKLQQVVAEMPLTQKLAQPVREIDSEKPKQPAPDFPEAFAFVPWGGIIVSSSQSLKRLIRPFSISATPSKTVGLVIVWNELFVMTYTTSEVMLSPTLPRNYQRHRAGSHRR